MSEMPDPATLPTEVLEREVTTLAAHISAATCRWLLLVAELDRREAWLTWGARSCAHWLSLRCGIGLSAAREHVRVGHALRHLSLVRAQFGVGALSFSQVRALVRVATPTTEDALVDLAQHATGAQLERIVRATLRASASDEERRYERRDVTTSWDDDGCLVVRARLEPAEGALLLAAMEAVDDVSAETPEARRADAFVAVVRNGIGGDGPAIPCEISIVVEADGSGHLAGGPGLAPETVEQLRCDAAAVSVVEGADGEQLHLGRRSRRPNTAQRRAMRRRDGGCVFPGCPATRYVDAHHVDWWQRDNGCTDLPVLVSLCRFHHRQVHKGRVLVAADGGGGFRFCRADGRPVEAARAGGRAGEVRFVDEVDEKTCVPRWGGERLDLDLAVTAMLTVDRRSGPPTRSA